MSLRDDMEVIRTVATKPYHPHALDSILAIVTNALDREIPDAHPPLPKPEGFDGGPAFPFVMADPSSYHTEEGMTLRDWFAGMAMQGFNANPTIDFASIDMAEAAYKDADAMLAARERKEGA